MKTFYSAEDIENFADQGRREICIDENIVLTDLAKQTAHMLGIRITEKPSGASSGTFTPARTQPVRQKPAIGNKPRGCQRQPGDKPSPEYMIGDLSVDRSHHISHNVILELFQLFGNQGKRQ